MQHALLSRMEELINSKFESFEQRVSSNQKELSQSQLSAIQQSIGASEGYSFRKKGHEQQFRVNSKVMDSLNRADGFMQDAIREGTNEALDSARGQIAEGIRLLSHRQKCIKLADSSEHGWRVVQEYESHPLADDSEDEKKIQRAQYQADRKFRNERRSRAKRFDPYNKPVEAARRPGDSSTSNSASGRKPGTCFRCGRAGHWRSECKVVQESGENQISINSVFDVFNNERKHCCSFDKGIEHDKNFQNVDGSSGSPVGRLKDNVDHWVLAGACSNVIDVIKQRYKLPFKNIPCKIELPNNRSAIENACFVTEEINKLLIKGCIQEVSSAPYVVNPLTVAQGKSGKKRLVLDCRHINPELFKFKCCYEDQSVARQMFSTGDYLFTFDIRSAYHHIMIYPEHCTYLGFPWNSGNSKKYYVYVVLPFGISTAGYIFTKVMRAIVEKWRSMGFKLVIFLDDGLGGDSTFDSALYASSYMQNDLLAFGFLIANEKCNWFPCLGAAWLGLEWDTASGKMHVSKDRLNRAKHQIDEIVARVSKGTVLISVRHVAAMVGQLLSMQCVIGKTVRLRTRSLYKCISNRASWNASVKIDVCALEEMLYWKNSLDSLNECDIMPVRNACANADQFKNVFVDASGSGFGSFIEGELDSQVMGTWSYFESNFSSTWRELEAVHRTVSNHSNRLRGHDVIVNTDNKNVCNILETGSRKANLQEIALNIASKCERNDIKIKSVWVPRKLNQKADLLSRTFDSDDWSVLDWVYGELEVKWGPHTFDRFASDYNTKCGLGLDQSIKDELAETGIEHESFGRLVESMSSYLVGSRARTTSDKYFGYFKKWEEFISSKGGEAIPASPILVALYITELMSKKCSYGVIYSTVYSIKWAHSLKGLVDPTENLFVKNLLQTAKRDLSKPVIKKEPVSKDILLRLCGKYTETTDVIIVRDLCMILLGFSGFLRYDEIRNLRCNDLKLHDSHFSLRIRKSKTDQYRQGNELVIAKGCTVACPYSTIKRYLDITGQTTDTDMFLFRPCFRSRLTCKLIYKDKPLSYTRARETILGRLREIAGGGNFGLHSLRAGGATLAANSGANDRCWKRHGRWKGENSKDGYVADSLMNRLEITRKLKL